MRLKVYGKTGFREEAPAHRQTREIIATTSWVLAAIAFRSSVYQARTWGSVTGNEEELRVALAKPGVLFWRPLDHHGPGGWREVESKEARHAPRK